MIAPFIGRRTIGQHFLQEEGKLSDLLLHLRGHRCLYAEAEDLPTFQESLASLRLVHARALRRPPQSSRRKPVSLPSEDFPVEVEQLSAVARRRGNSADLHQHLDALSISVTTYHVSKTLGHIDDAASAISFFVWASRQPGFAHNTHTFMSLVSILARAKEFDRLWELLSAMHEAGLTLPVVCFNVIIKAYGEMGNDKEAIETFRKMHAFGVLPTAYSYNTLIGALLKSQKIDLAMEFHREMLQASDFEGNAFSCSMIVSALCNAGRLQEALEIAKDAEKWGTLASQFTWTSLIDGFCKAGKIEKGVELFSSMKNMGIEPTAVTYSVIIGGLSKSGKISDAFAYIERMKNDHLEPTDMTYTPLLNAICKAGRTDEAIELLNQISASNGAANPIQCQILVTAYARYEKIDEACAMYDRMVKNGCQPSASTYAVLIKGLWVAGRSNDAVKIFYEMKAAKCEPNAAVYKVMVSELAKAGFKDEAEKIFLEMMEKGYEASASTWKELIKCFCERDDFITAKKTIRAILDKNFELNMSTVCIYLKCLCNASQVHTASEFLKEMSKHGLEPNTYAYNIVIHGAYKAGELEKALDLCSEMQRKGCTQDIYTYAELCKIAWKARNAEALIVIYEHMRKQSVRANPFVFSVIVKGLCTMNKMPEACSVCSQIFEDGFMLSESTDSGSNLDKVDFVNVQVFLPLLFHLQDCGGGKEMFNLWDSILQKGIFSW